jgi:plasmid stabilization system protein ParE
VAPRSVDFHPQAIADAEAAGKWYAANSGDGTAAKFERELERAVRLIADAPLRWPEHHRGTRRYWRKR